MLQLRSVGMHIADDVETYLLICKVSRLMAKKRLLVSQTYAWPTSKWLCRDQARLISVSLCLPMGTMFDTTDCDTPIRCNLEYLFALIDIVPVAIEMKGLGA